VQLETRVAGDDRLEVLAAALRQAEAAGVSVQPLTETDPSLSVVDAYRIQTLNRDRRLAGGVAITGRKVGLTSRAMQKMMGVHEPDFGVLFADMLVEDGDAIETSSLIQPRVEAEIAMVLGRELCGPGLSAAACLQAIDFAVASIEVIDSRIRDWKIGLVDTIADNASSARFVTAARSLRAQDLDLRLVGMALQINGEVVETGAGAAVLGNPARCVAWLANKLSEFGERLLPGQVVLAGALHRAIPVKAGDVVVAEFDRLGAVHVRFV
jgi:2-keto-4-pentenoate hydratase